MNTRDALLAHVEACRDATTAGNPRPQLPDRLRDLRGVDLSRVDLSGSNMRGVCLTGAELAWASLRGANLHDAGLHRVDLRGADLREATITGANLRGANLREADLRGADLGGANLAWADLAWANLHGANLHDADLYEVDMTGADLSGTGAMRIIGAYEATIYPDGRLVYGCETHTLDDWDDLVGDLCVKHEQDNVAYYEAEIRALVALARVVVAGDLPERPVVDPGCRRWAFFAAAVAVVVVLFWIW